MKKKIFFALFLFLLLFLPFGSALPNATLVFKEDFERGVLSGNPYYEWWVGNDKGNAHKTITTEKKVSGNYAGKYWLEPTAPASESHRAYPVLHMSVDTPLVATWWTWLDYSPYYWFSLVTFDDNPDWSSVITTANLDDTSGRLHPVHVNSFEYINSIPFPKREWVRITTYLDYSSGYFHTWQNGQEISKGSFRHDQPRIVRWHWGLYAGKDVSSALLYEDDIQIWKLDTLMTDFSAEPLFGNQNPTATLIFEDDFESGNFDKWYTGSGSSTPSCAGFEIVENQKYVSSNKAFLATTTCAMSSSLRAHPLINNPQTGNPIVLSFWTWLDSNLSTYNGGSKWLSFITVTDDCSPAWLRTVHVNIGNNGERLGPDWNVNPDYVSERAFPTRQWARITAYFDYAGKYMYVWQDGQPMFGANFSPRLDAAASQSVCQWRVGLYAGKETFPITMYQDDVKMWRLNAPLTDFSTEPLFDDSTSQCVTLPILMDNIFQWKNGALTMTTLLQKIKAWKTGTGC